MNAHLHHYHFRFHFHSCYPRLLSSSKKKGKQGRNPKKEAANFKLDCVSPFKFIKTEKHFSLFIHIHMNKHFKQFSVLQKQQRRWKSKKKMSKRVFVAYIAYNLFWAVLLLKSCFKIMWLFFFYSTPKKQQQQQQRWKIVKIHQQTTEEAIFHFFFVVVAILLYDIYLENQKKQEWQPTMIFRKWSVNMNNERLSRCYTKMNEILLRTREREKKIVYLI